MVSILGKPSKYNRNGIDEREMLLKMLQNEVI